MRGAVLTKRIDLFATLLYYDGIQIFEGRDRIGGKYVGVAIELIESKEPAFAIVGVAPTQLQQFRLGQIDLLAIMEARGGDPWFLGELETTEDGLAFVMAEDRSGPIPDTYLPESGLFILHAFDPSNEDVITEAAARSTLALELKIQSQIPSDEHRIRATDLSGLLVNFQSLVKNAYRKITATVGRANKAFDSLSSLLDVAVPAKPGSFKMILVPAQQNDLFGDADVGRGLELIDELLSSVDDPQATLERVKKYTGHTASSLVKLIRFIVEQNLTIKYSWTSPHGGNVSSRTITQREAVPLLDLLSSTENLQIERFAVTGRLTVLNINSESWRIDSLDSSDHFIGKCAPGVTVSGLTGGEVYTFVCEEKIEEVAATVVDRALDLARCADR